MSNTLTVRATFTRVPWVLVVLVFWGAAAARAEDGAVGVDRVRVAIYDHSDGISKGRANLARILTADNGFEAERVGPEDVRDGALEDFDVLIMPGGSGSGQARKLEEKGRVAIRDFVRDGGGYVGICAGSYLASSHYSWSLNLINAKVWDRSHWARGQGPVTLRMTGPGDRVIGGDLRKGGRGKATTVEVHYAQGPLLVPDDEPELPGYQVLATFETEIAEKGAPVGAMIGTHAIIRSMYGQGRVICFSPHPEVEDGPNALITAGVHWAGGRRHTQRE